MIEHFNQIISDNLSKVRIQLELFDRAKSVSDAEFMGYSLKSMADRLYESSLSRIFSGSLELIVLKTC